MIRGSKRRVLSVLTFAMAATFVTSEWPTTMAVGQIANMQTQSEQRDSGKTREKVNASKIRAEALSNDQLAILNNKKTKFEKLTAKDQNRIRQIHDRLNDHESSSKLRDVMHRYYDWLKTLDTIERNELLDLPPAKRVERIRELMNADAKKLFGTYGESKLPEEDIDVVIRWIKSTMSKKRPTLVAKVRSEQFRKAIPKTRKTTSQSPYFPYPVLREVDPEHLTDVIFEEIAALRSELSGNALRIFDDYDEKQQRRLVLNWIDAAIVGRQPINDQTLIEYYETALTESERKEMDRYDVDMFTYKLRRLYQEDMQSGRKRTSTGALPKKNRMDEKRRPARSRSAN